jgi:hypothetical protein
MYSAKSASAPPTTNGMRQPQRSICADVNSTFCISNVNERDQLPR